jgi:xanthine dehydrogenase YagR molybdenum-binding subunit
MTQPGDERHMSSMQAFGALFAEVAVDRDFGLIRMRRLVGAYGVGRVVNPRMTRSQAIGGMVGGIGMARILLNSTPSLWRKTIRT